MEEFVEEINYIGISTIATYLTPYLVQPAINMGKDILKGVLRNQLKKQLEKFIKDNFENAIISTITEFILHIIEENYDKIRHLSPKKMGEYIISKITRQDKKNEENKSTLRKKSPQKSTVRKIYDTFVPGNDNPYEERRYKKTSNPTWNKSTPIRFKNK